MVKKNLKTVRKKQSKSAPKKPIGKKAGAGKPAAKKAATKKPVNKTRAKAEAAPTVLDQPEALLEATRAAGVVDQIVSMAAGSRIAQYRWLDDSGNRGKAPPAYIKGMAVVYARVYCKLKARDAAAMDMARKASGAALDALTPYAPVFARLGMRNDRDGVDTLRHLFVLLMGLGVRESSGYHCRGRYMNQGFSHADDAEAGLFQTAYGLRNKCPAILNPMIAHYSANPSGFLEIFSDRITCNANDWRNWGDPSEPGYKFQQFTKMCPAFAAEYAAVGMRHSLTSWGPLRRQTPEVVPDCDELYKAVERIMEGAPGLCAQVM